MTTLAEFVTARLAEEEASPAPGRRALDDLRFELKRGDPYEQHLSSRIEDGLDAQAAAWHERARREVTAKRAILAAHARVDDGWLPGNYVTCGECSSSRQVVKVGPGYKVSSWPCPTVRHLAAIWCDHPDYDPAWRPE